MTYLLHFLLVPLYYFVLRLMTTRREADRLFVGVVTVHAILFRALANPYNYVDTRNYANAFKTISGWTLKHTIIDSNAYTEWGRGYLGFNWLLGRVSTDPKMLFVVTSIIAVGAVMLYYKKTLYTVLAPILFYLSYYMMYTMGFGVLRQHLAIPFLLFALYYMEKPKASLCFALLATLLHTGCIAFFPFYLVRWLSKKLSYAEVALLCLSAFIVARFSIVAVLSFFPRFESYLHAEAKNNIVPVLLIGFMLLLLYEADVYRQVKNKTDSNVLLFLLYGLGLSLFCVGLPGGGRLTLPVVYVVPVAIGFLYQYGGKTKDEYYICIVGLAVLTLIGIYLGLGEKGNMFADYSFFWERR